MGLHWNLKSDMMAAWGPNAPVYDTGRPSVRIALGKTMAGAGHHGMQAYLQTTTNLKKQQHAHACTKNNNENNQSITLQTSIDCLIYTTPIHKENQGVMENKNKQYRNHKNN